MTASNARRPVTLDEPEPTEWTLADIAEFLSTERHTFHVAGETFSFIDGTGKHSAESMRATCSCGISISGLTTAEQVFAVVKDHCQPL